MTDRMHIADTDDHLPDIDMDIVITRLVDGEATADDTARFEHAAAAEPTLWRELALRQRDMRALADEVAAHTRTACAVELPERRSGRISWMLALSGWAAVFVLALMWFAVLIDQPTLNRGGDLSRAELTSVDHYEEYVQAPFVMGELQPVVVEVQELPDGRVAVHFIRRVEEVALLDPEQTLPVDDNGELTRDLRRLRGSEPIVGFMN